MLALFKLFTVFVHCCFSICYFHRLEHKNEFVNQITMGHRSKSVACNVVFMTFRLRRFHSLPCGFMRFQHTTRNCFWSFSDAISDCANTFGRPFGASLLQSMTAATGLSSFLLAFFESFFVVLVVRIDEVNPSQSLSIVELRLLFCFSRIWAALPIFVHSCGHTWSGLVVVWTLVNLPPNHM